MSNDNAVTLIGNVTRDPEIKFIPSGAAVVEFGIAINKRVKDGDEWVDGDPQFYDVKAWRNLAENVAETIHKGMRVIVHGELEFRQWETDDGEKRSKVAVVATAVGPDLTWATASVSRNEKGDRKPAKPAAKKAAPKAEPEDPFGEEPF